MALITVIVPVYKVENYLRECIDSILFQSFQDFELVLVDDGSPDSCPQICDTYAAKDPRVKVIHKQNEGPSGARNVGIDWAMENSKSEWIAFVDSDDCLHPDYLSILYKTAIKHSADLVICDFTGLNENRAAEEQGFFDLVTEDKHQIYECLCVNWHIISPCNKLYHKSIFDNLRFPPGKYHEDTFIIHRILWNSHRVAFIPDVLYYVRHHKNSIMTSETPKTKLDGLEAMIDQYEFGLEHCILPLYSGASIGYLNEYAALKSDFTKQDSRRYKELKKRFAKVYFSRKVNRSLKRYMGFFFSETYCKLSSMVKGT